MERVQVGSEGERNPQTVFVGFRWNGFLTSAMSGVFNPTVLSQAEDLNYPRY